MIRKTRLLFLCLIFITSAGSAEEKENPYPDMVYIPAGYVDMGSNDEEIDRAMEMFKSAEDTEPVRNWFDDETPKHRVWVDAYYLDKYEVTNRDFMKFVRAGGYKKKIFWSDEGRNCRLIVAFKKLKDTTSLPHAMVIAGKKGWAYNGVRDLVNRLGIEKDVIFLDYIDDNDLVLLYNTASLFIMPSLYEGFGLPVLEAMACGTPVVASNVSSIPEVLKDAGILVNPYDKDSICDGMFRVLTDVKLQEELREKSLKRAKFFSWEKTARLVLREYETLETC